jgi:hypothetical protein
MLVSHAVEEERRGGGGESGTTTHFCTLSLKAVSPLRSVHAVPSSAQIRTTRSAPSFRNGPAVLTMQAARLHISRSDASSVRSACTVPTDAGSLSEARREERRDGLRPAMAQRGDVGCEER